MTFACCSSNYKPQFWQWGPAEPDTGGDCGAGTLVSFRDPKDNVVTKANVTLRSCDQELPYMCVSRGIRKVLDGGEHSH